MLWVHAARSKDSTATTALEITDEINNMLFHLSSLRLVTNFGHFRSSIAEYDHYNNISYESFRSDLFVDRPSVSLKFYFLDRVHDRSRLRYISVELLQTWNDHRLRSDWDYNSAGKKISI